jgi:hypothetical protein
VAAEEELLGGSYFPIGMLDMGVISFLCSIGGGAATGAGLAIGRGGGVYAVLGGSSSRFLFHIRGALLYEK